MIDIERLRKFAPGGRADVLAAIVELSRAPGEGRAGEAMRAILDAPLRVQHWLAQCAHESAWRGVAFSRLEESGNYSASRLRAVFGRHFTPAQARAYAGKPKAILSRAYANRMGNGPESSGDGWDFRARGIIGITGRWNYRHYGGLLGIDLEAEPERAGEPEIAVQVAALYWAEVRLDPWADRDDVLAVSRGINLGDPRSGGWPNGLADRKRWLAKAKSLSLGEDSFVSGGHPPAGDAPTARPPVGGSDTPEGVSVGERTATPEGDASTARSAEGATAPRPVGPNPAADAAGTLRIGDEGEAVAALQRALKSAGYPVGTIDGIYGEMTRGAVILAQDRLGLEGEKGVWRVADTPKLAAPEAIPIPERRRETAAPDLKEQGDGTISLIERLKGWLSWLGFGGVVSGAAATTAPDLIDAFTTAWAPIALAADFIKKHPYALWGAAALLAYWGLSRIAARYADGYRAGRNMGDEG